jgi:hypothetical protein
VLSPRGSLSIYKTLQRERSVLVRWPRALHASRGKDDDSTQFNNRRLLTWVNVAPTVRRWDLHLLSSPGSCVIFSLFSRLLRYLQFVFFYPQLVVDISTRTGCFVVAFPEFPGTARLPCFTIAASRLVLVTAARDYFSASVFASQCHLTFSATLALVPRTIVLNCPVSVIGAIVIKTHFFGSTPDYLKRGKVLFQFLKFSE